MERRKRIISIYMAVVVVAAIVVGLILYITLKPSLGESKFDYNYGITDSVMKVGDRKEIEISEKGKDFVFTYDVKNKEVVRIDTEENKMYVRGIAEGESKIEIKVIGKNIVYENEVTITVIEEKATEPETPPQEENPSKPTEPEKPNEPTEPEKPSEPTPEEPVQPSTPEDKEYTEGEIGLRFEDCEFEIVDNTIILKEDVDYFKIKSNFNIEKLEIIVEVKGEEKELEPVFNNTYEIKDEGINYLLKINMTFNDGEKSFEYTKVFLVIRNKND